MCKFIGRFLPVPLILLRKKINEVGASITPHFVTSHKILKKPYKIRLRRA